MEEARSRAAVEAVGSNSSATMEARSQAVEEAVEPLHHLPAHWALVPVQWAEPASTKGPSAYRAASPLRSHSPLRSPHQIHVGAQK